MRPLLIPIALLGLASCSKSGGSTWTGPPDTELVATATREVDAMDKKRRDALAVADGAVVPRPDLGECPVKFDPILAKPKLSVTGSKEANAFYDVPPWDPKGDVLGGHFADEMVAIDRIGIATADEVAVKPGPRKLRTDDYARSSSKSDYQRQTLQKAGDPKEEPNDFELVIDREKAPKIVSDKEFEPGILIARFYVWDYPKAQIVCAARIVVLSSERLSVRYKGTEKDGLDKATESGLRSDLREQALVEAQKRLSAAGPPMADAGVADAPPIDAGKRSSHDAGR